MESSINFPGARPTINKWPRNRFIFSMLHDNNVCIAQSDIWAAGAQHESFKYSLLFSFILLNP